MFGWRRSTCFNREKEHTMTEKYDRLEVKDLALAVPAGSNNHRSLDLIRVPQFGDEQTYTPLQNNHSGEPKHRHIYSRSRSTLKTLQSVSMQLNWKQFGQINDSDRVASDLEWKAQNFEEDDDYNIVGLDERLRDIVTEYNAIREQKMIARAKRLGKIVARSQVFIVAAAGTDLDSAKLHAPDYYVAPAVDMAVLRDGNAMGVEPVVEGLSGKRGFMPERFYSMYGLYAPTQQ